MISGRAISSTRHAVCSVHFRTSRNCTRRHGRTASPSSTTQSTPASVSQFRATGTSRSTAKHTDIRRATSTRTSTRRSTGTGPVSRPPPSDATIVTPWANSLSISSADGRTGRAERRSTSASVAAGSGARPHSGSHRREAASQPRTVHATYLHTFASSPTGPAPTSSVEPSRTPAV